MQEQISHIISTVNKLEDDDSRPTKLEFDIKRIWPLKSNKTSQILKACHQIELFLNEYNTSINATKTAEMIQEPIPSAPLIEDDNLEFEANENMVTKSADWALIKFPFQQLARLWKMSNKKDNEILLIQDLVMKAKHEAEVQINALNSEVYKVRVERNAIEVLLTDAKSEIKVALEENFEARNAHEIQINALNTQVNKMIWLPPMKSFCH